MAHLAHEGLIIGSFTMDNWYIYMENIKFISETKFKSTEIGEIPEDWEVVKVEERKK